MCLRRPRHLRERGIAQIPHCLNAVVYRRLVKGEPYVPRIRQPPLRDAEDVQRRLFLANGQAPARAEGRAEGRADDDLQEDGAEQEAWQDVFGEAVRNDDFDFEEAFGRDRVWA